MLPVKIKIITMGKRMKEYEGIISFYENRIRKLCRFEVSKEKRIPDYAIALDENGMEMNSDEFYNLIASFSKNGKEVIFAIGPAEGFGNIKNRKISLSKLTLQHDLAYLILLEQLYRSLLRMKGTKYHR